MILVTSHVEYCNALGYMLFNQFAYSIVFKLFKILNSAFFYTGVSCTTMSRPSSGMIRDELHWLRVQERRHESEGGGGVNALKGGGQYSKNTKI